MWQLGPQLRSSGAEPLDATPTGQQTLRGTLIQFELICSANFRWSKHARRHVVIRRSSNLHSKDFSLEYRSFSSNKQFINLTLVRSQMKCFGETIGFVVLTARNSSAAMTPETRGEFGTLRLNLNFRSDPKIPATEDQAPSDQWATVVEWKSQKTTLCEFVFEQLQGVGSVFVRWFFWYFWIVCCGFLNVCWLWL
jgi:hypothetical protein